MYQLPITLPFIETFISDKICTDDEGTVGGYMCTLFSSFPNIIYIYLPFMNNKSVNVNF